MTNTETLEEFYQKKFNHLPQNLKQDIGHFNVFNIEDHVGPNGTPPKYSRREFYKISMMRGNNIYHYADKSIEVAGTTLMFFNPSVPYALDCSPDNASGFFCIFTEGFFSGQLRGSIQEFPMFAPGGKPAYSLDEAQDKQVSQIFKKMQEEINSDYMYKYDLLRNYVTEIIHYALKVQLPIPSTNTPMPNHASQRCLQSCWKGSSRSNRPRSGSRSVRPTTLLRN